MSSSWELFATGNFREPHSTRYQRCDYFWLMLKVMFAVSVGPSVCVKHFKWYRCALSTCLSLFVLMTETDPIVETLPSVRNITRWPKPRTAPILRESERCGTDLTVFTHIRGVCSLLSFTAAGSATVRTRRRRGSKTRILRLALKNTRERHKQNSAL